MYIAVKYIGTDFTPGEIIPDGLDEAFVTRLLKSGAIREAAPEPVAESATIPAPDLSIPSTADEESLGEEEIEEELEPEPPEVDVSAGLVQEVEEKKTKGAGRKKGGTKK